jgi:hypothetical protein
VVQQARNLLMDLEDAGSSTGMTPRRSWRAARAVREVQPGPAPGENQADRVRAARGPTAAARGEGKPETFSFLGLTHICVTSRGGRFWIRRITDAKRLRAKLRQARAENMRRRHLPIPEQGKWLASVVRGHQAYYAVLGNISGERIPHPVGCQNCVMCSGCSVMPRGRPVGPDRLVCPARAVTG